MPDVQIQTTNWFTPHSWQANFVYWVVSLRLSRFNTIQFTDNKGKRRVLRLDYLNRDPKGFWVFHGVEEIPIRQNKPPELDYEALTAGSIADAQLSKPDKDVETREVEGSFYTREEGNTCQLTYIE